MWRDEKIAILRKNRDYSRLLDGDDAEAQTPRGQTRGRIKDSKFDEEDDDVSLQRQEYLDRRRRLKELERQKLTKGKNGLHANGTRGKEESKAGDQNRANGGSSSRGDAGLALVKDKKKLPYDRSFGSFFGPSEPVVAKRIIEEARAREEAEIVAARDAKASREVERKKSLTISTVTKVSHDRKLTQRPPKPVDETTERARKLKEARDYSFLFDESPLPDPKTLQKKGPATSKLGEGRHDSAFGGAKNPPLRKPPLGQPKSTLGARNSDRPTTSSRPIQSQLKSSQPSKPLRNQDTRDHYAADKSAVQNRSKVPSSAKPLPNKVSSAGPGRPDTRKEAEAKKEMMMRKLANGFTSSNGNKSSSTDRRPLPSPTVDRRTSQLMARRPSLPADRPIQPGDKRPTQGTDRNLAQSKDRRPAQATGKRPAQSIDRLPAPSSERRPAQVTDKRPAQVTDSRVGTLRPVVSQGLKKGGPGSATYVSTAGGAVKRQSLQPKPTLKGASRPAPSNYNRARYSDGSRQIQRKRARSSSEESDDRPRHKSKLPDVRINSIRHAEPSDDDIDSFIDDDDDDGPANVSRAIQNIFRYNRNKYPENDDFDDRDMEVGFRDIQAEERRSAREARLEDEREWEAIQAEEKAERLRKAKKKRK